MLHHLRAIQQQVLYAWDTEHHLPSDASAFIDVLDARRSAVHVVAETIFSEDKCHITEKSLRPMVMRQPFVVFGGAFCLRYLRSYGFRTFGDVWDESYDDEIDPDRRLRMVLDLLHNLARMNKGDFDALLRRCQDTVNHNQQHFFSEQFEKNMLHEFHSNMRTSIVRQQQLMLSDPGGSLMWVYDQHRRSGRQPRASMKHILQEMHRTSKVMFGDRYQLIKQQHPWMMEHLS